jgi:hypothetical protein
MVRGSYADGGCGDTGVGCGRGHAARVARLTRVFPCSAAGEAPATLPCFAAITPGQTRAFRAAAGPDLADAVGAPSDMAAAGVTCLPDA